MVWHKVAAFLVASSVVAPAWAQVCPRAQLEGPVALVKAVKAYLPEPQPHDFHTATCLRMVVKLRPDSAGLRMTAFYDGADVENRVVRSPRTAAMLIESWTFEPVSDAFGSSAVVDSVRSLPSGGGRVAIDRNINFNQTSAPSWLWVAALGSLSPGQTWGGGFEAGWEYGEVWRVGPAFQLRIENEAAQPGLSGAHMIDTALGVNVGPTVAVGGFLLSARAGLFAALRNVSPDSAVGPILCSPFDPCELNEQAPEVADAYWAATAWSTMDVAVDVAAFDGWSLGAILGIAATPGHLTLGAPKVEPRGANDRVRNLPPLPNWRASLRLGVRWSTIL